MISPSTLKGSDRKQFRTVGEIVCHAANVLRPPERLTTSQAAEKYVHLHMPGSYTGPYRNAKAPYMVEPQDVLQSREYDGMIFVGPAQCGKTQSLLLNWLAATIMTQPMDMIFYNPTQANARDFSARRVDRLHRYSPDVGEHLLKRRDADNKTDKHYDNGMILTLSYPSKNEFAGKPVGLIGLTDYDRMDDDIDGDGSPYELASKRTTTFKSFAMTMAESSPSRPIVDLRWIRKTAHEAPPCKGILGLYNQGDRRRWQWPCTRCGNYFEGEFEHLEYKMKDSPAASGETVRMRCPYVNCRELIHPDERYQMNLRGRWIKDGQSVLPDGTVIGEGIRSSKASFWLKGPAASFITWQKLVENFINASRTYDTTGSEDALRKFYNNDLALPYTPKSVASIRTAEEYISRKEPIGGTADVPEVPAGVRFILPIVDVQKSMFVVQVVGVSPGRPFDMTVIDRYNLRLNEEGREDGDGQREWVKPGTYLKDWELIVKHVLKRPYPLAGEPNRLMWPKMVGCDSGGRAGVTANAYQFYRRLRRDGLNARFTLLKGTGLPGAPRAKVTFPDSSQRDLKAAAQGDVPVLLLNSNILKDTLSGRIEGLVPGNGMIRFPEWLPDWFFEELCAETRTEKGWEKISGKRNEAWDLLYYALGICVSPMLNVEQIDWTKPPSWAAEWDANSLVTATNAPGALASEAPKTYDFSKFSQVLAG